MELSFQWVDRPKCLTSWLDTATTAGLTLKGGTDIKLQPVELDFEAYVKWDVEDLSKAGLIAWYTTRKCLEPVMLVSCRYFNYSTCWTSGPLISSAHSSGFSFILLLSCITWGVKNHLLDVTLSELRVAQISGRKHTYPKLAKVS